MTSRFECIACYIMASGRNGTLYVGSTNNIVRRAFEHAEGAGARFTIKYSCTQLVWYELFEEMAPARNRERTIKGWPRRWKLELIENENPDWSDLKSVLL
jgi:putative endonuclease